MVPIFGVIIYANICAGWNSLNNFLKKKEISILYILQKLRNRTAAFCIMSIFRNNISADYSEDLLQIQFNQQSEILLNQASEIQQIRDLNSYQTAQIAELNEKINLLYAFINNMIAIDSL